MDDGEAGAGGTPPRPSLIATAGSQSSQGVGRGPLQMQTGKEGDFVWDTHMQDAEEEVREGGARNPCVIP